MFYTGIVESRSDPLKLGRCQVRIVGLHTHDKTQLPTQQLPWATPVQQIGSAAMNGIGYTPVGPVEGTTVIIMFADEEMQQPIMLGTIGGIPHAPQPVSDDDSATAVQQYNIKDITLRTIEGPVTGKQLTFIDKETGKTNLTGGLTANMKVLGFGLTTECTIVSVDSPTQITINELVTGYGENIITFKPAATNLAAVNTSKASTVLTDGSGNPVVSGDGTPVQTTPPTPTSTTPESPAPTATNTAIPTVPPPKSSTNASKASDGIKAIIAACDKVGLTTKEQKCALLGIAGGESGWIPQLEGYNYSASRMKQIYSFATDDDIAKYSEAKQKGVTRQQFFSWAYGVTKSPQGKKVGNKSDEDGGKYFGRGFIQLTGRGNYERYQKLGTAAGLNIDIVNNPDSLDNDINVSAMIAALYIKDRTPKAVKPNAHPDFFYAAKAATGVNSPDIAAKKLKYYEYFYGDAAGGAIIKDANPPSVEPPKDGSNPTPGPSEASIANGTDNTGFRDPNNKYPLKDYIGEPDTNRLARGIVDGTIVEKKDSSIRTGVPTANKQGDWDQNPPAYGAQYPYNKVYESESGHIQEFDDTPGYERIHTYHRVGTYHEIDPNGTQTNYIVGDNFMITERNGFIHIGGDYNLTVDGGANIFCRSEANIEVASNAIINVGNNVELGVANDMSMSIGGDMKLKVGGTFNIAADNMTVKSANNLFMQAGVGTSIKSQSVQMESASDMNILAGGTLHADYSQGQFGNGASGAQDVEDFALPPPDAGVPLNPTVPALTPPDRRIADGAAAETPQDYNTPEGRAESAKQNRESGVTNPPPAVVTETPTTPGGGSNTVVPTDCKIIYNTTNFTNDFRMSKNFTLGMLMWGGLNGDHKLVDQQLTGDDGKIRTYTVQEIVCNLATTAANMLEPALEVLPGGISGKGKQWIITSGYRLKGVIPTESPNSSHCKGFAIDIALSTRSLRDTYELAQKLEKILPYDQIILEYRHKNQVWVHLGYGKTQRKQAFTMLNDKTYQGTYPKGGFVLVDAITPPGAVVKG